MKKINIKNLSLLPEEVVVTGMIGDLTVREYIKKENLVDEILRMRMSEFNDDEVCEVLVDYLPDDISLQDSIKRAREIIEVTRDEVEELVEMENQKAADWEEEHKFLKNWLQGGIA